MDRVSNDENPPAPGDIEPFFFYNEILLLEIPTIWAFCRLNRAGGEYFAKSCITRLFFNEFHVTLYQTVALFFLYQKSFELNSI